MKNKGFTLVELIATFVLCSVIVILLINVVLVLKSVYMETKIKTDLLINQSNLATVLNSNVKENNVVSICECSDSYKCYRFAFSSGETKDLIIKSDYIKFGEYVYKLDEGSEIQTLDSYLTLDSQIITDNTKKNSILNINIPIYNNRYPNFNYGVNFNYIYKSISETSEVVTSCIN